MINIGTIYKITNPKGKVYIGQTTNFEKRISHYRLGKVKSQKKIYNSLQKYGWESHTVGILYTGPLTEEGLNQLEIHYIRIYNSFKGGLNMTLGGDRPPSWKGKKHSEETKAKTSAALQGRKHSLERIAKIATALKGRQAYNKGKKLSPEHIAKRSEAKQKEISQYTKEGVWIKDWPSLKEASSILGINSGNISSCLKGNYKTSGGFIWKYSEE